MAPVNTPPIEQARSIFSDLGYSVSGDGEEFRATRKWREVRVTALADAVDAPESGDLRCFVTWSDQAGKLRRRLARANPDYEWAIIGVTEGGDYEVARAPGTAVVSG